MFKKTLGCLVVICLPLSLVGNSYGWDIPTPPSDCPGGCDRYLRTPNTYVPTGPTEKELKKQREAKDTKEAADDAEDKGDSAYRYCDYAGAAKYFKESLEYSPDDSNIRNKLGLAQDHLAAKQLAAVKESVGNGDCYDGRKGCTPGTSVVTFPSQGRPRGVASIPPDVLAKWGKTREGKQLIEKEGGDNGSSCAWQDKCRLYQCGGCEKPCSAATLCGKDSG